MSNDGKKIHRCQFEGCKASFSRPHKLEFHIFKHKGEKPFVCTSDGCSKSYTTPSHLKRHKKTVHENVDINTCVLCKLCGLHFSNKFNLKKHFNCKHNENGFPFKCTQCSTGFKKKRHLAEHMSIHSGESPYKCEVCNCGFSKIHLLNKHKRNHKTYTCDCGETFPRWTLFCSHRKNICTIQVIDHKCIICNKIFTTKSNLKSHSLIHLNESQREIFQCHYKKCTRRYQIKKNLNEHIRTFHQKSKEKLTLNCTEPDCHAVLASYVNLKRHLLNVHKTKFKRKSTRKTRKDSGKQKKSMAAILAGVDLSKDQHIAVISGLKGNTILQSYNGGSGEKGIVPSDLKDLINTHIVTSQSDILHNSDLISKKNSSPVMIDHPGYNQLPTEETIIFNTTPMITTKNETFGELRTQNTVNSYIPESSENSTLFSESFHFHQSSERNNFSNMNIYVYTNIKATNGSASETDFDTELLKQCNETLHKLKSCAAKTEFVIMKHE